MPVADENVLCAKCDYSLKGLPDPGMCPDCGNPFNAARNKGVKLPGRGRTHMSGTMVVTAMVTGMLGMLFCPCTGLAWLNVHHLQNPTWSQERMAVYMTVLSVGLFITWLVSVCLAIKDWWEVSRELRRRRD